MANVPAVEMTPNFHSEPSLEEQNVPENVIVTPPQMMHPSRAPLSVATREEYVTICVPLYQAALNGDLEAAKGIIERYPWVVRAAITKYGDTVLHIAAAANRVDFVEELVGVMTPEDLELQNNNQNTALCYAALSGNLRIAELMVNKNDKLPMIRGSEGMTPLYMACLFGRSDLVWYLYNNTNIQELDILTDGIGIFNKCISSDLYDVALHMVKKYPVLAVLRDGAKETALHVLARKPSAFPSESDDSGKWKKFIHSIPCVKQVGRQKRLKQLQARQLVQFIWQEIIKQEESDISELIGTPTRLLFTAAKLGNTAFLIELIRSYPDLIWKVDEDRRSIFHFAVLHRHERIFSLIHEIGSIKDILTSYRDENDNNILHLAGMLAPPHQLRVVSGVALQVQRELLWFKEVESIVQPSYKEGKNREGRTPRESPIAKQKGLEPIKEGEEFVTTSPRESMVEGKTPRELFTETHKGLLKEGEEWMKNTASQSMLVATLIATVVFAAAFTVPGGNKGDTGIPILVKRSSFMIFAISDALALFTSSTSILMFLSILTSRYAEEDFLESLPFRLILGLATLFFSIITMMVAFSATFFLLYLEEFKWLPITITLFACVPIILFARLQYPLLKDMIRSTYGSKSLFKPTKKVLYKPSRSHQRATNAFYSSCLHSK